MLSSTKIPRADPASAVALAPTRAAMLSCLVELRARAERNGRRVEMMMIDSALASSLREQLMSRLGNPTLTPKQWEVLELIEQGRQADGVSPTIEEMADALGTSKPTVFDKVEALISKGVLIRQPYKSRSLRVADDPPEEAPREIQLLRSRREELTHRLQVEAARRPRRPEAVRSIQEEIEAVDVALSGEREAC
jgi:DNA-binding MarR family transcriptional regulator